MPTKRRAKQEQRDDGGNGMADVAKTKVPAAELFQEWMKDNGIGIKPVAIPFWIPSQDSPGAWLFRTRVELDVYYTEDREKQGG